MKYLNLNTILGVIATCGILGAFELVAIGKKAAPVALPISEPSHAIYKNFIAGAGIIESKSENIQIGTLIGGIVNKIFVKVHDHIKAGDQLFSLDARQAIAALNSQKATVAKNKTALLQAEAVLKDVKDKLSLTENLKDKRAISKEEIINRQNAVFIAKAAYNNCRATLKEAEANLKLAETNFEILTIKAPIDCEILQINIHPGEYAPANSSNLILIGNIEKLHVRTDIDENDAWRFKPNTNAIAYLRGNSAIKINLKFDHVEPYVLPKKSLTGDSIERVDTRVLQVIYSCEDNAYPVYIGQQVDVYIEVPGE